MSLAWTEPTPDQLTILFVDDDAAAMSGVIRALQRVHSDWDLQFVDNGAAALDVVAAQPVDVVLCDLRLTGRGGVELLREVRNLSPTTARVILSTDGDRRAIFDSTRVAHQYSEKPVNIDRLRQTIERIASCRVGLPADTVEAVLGAADELPTPGPIHDQLVAELRGDYTIRSLERIVTSDVALTAELLRLVNSAFFGLVRRLERVGDAITFLGVDVMSAIVASRSIFRPDPDSIVDVEAVNHHSQAVAALAAAAHGGTASGAHLKTQAFAAGLLHDVGVLALAQVRPDGISRAEAAGVLADHDLVHERLRFGADRYSVGRYLLSLWGFDSEIAAAVGALGHPVSAVERTGLTWTLRIAHEAVQSGRLGDLDVIEGDPIELKIVLAEIVEELDVRGAVSRPKHLAT